MTTKIKDLIIQNTKEQEQKRKSEIKALQAQINPHFLYNTLDSIIWMAESKKSEDVVVMASALAKLFRFSISKGEEIISLRSEIEHIKNYLTIQKIRYTDKLDFSIEVDDDILHCKTLKIILQPLAENSIYHGIKNKNGMRLIRITGKKTNNKILLQVIDNGVGMTPEKLENVLSKRNTVSDSKGVGVWNVHERLKLYFGDEFGLVFESQLDVGTKVDVWLPLIE
ncbi:sensor histidine kinase [Petroclostridium sp. X23]|uniref:sensor histidine kinase n=1 Tax=Petroclostridium sp. X23 TaxID=3045146 RepID=UPI0024ADAECE|nr:sensor histidine kinase [Petroclostridium sp. X23]WHH58073.1 sensor histidine kinase [Petroclostridium sp. X23]